MKTKLEKLRHTVKDEEGRLERAEAAVRHAEADVDAADPDDRGFSKLVVERDAARSRVAALAVRVGRAHAALGEAEEEAAAAEREARAAARAQLAADIAENESKITAEVLLFRERLAQLAREQAERIARVVASGAKPPPSFWANVAPGSELYAATGHDSVHRASEVARGGRF